MGGGVESPRVTDNTRVEELPQGDKTSWVTLEGHGVPGTDGWGRGVEGNSQSTLDTKDISKFIRGEDIESNQ